MMTSKKKADHETMTGKIDQSLKSLEPSVQNRHLDGVQLSASNQKQYIFDVRRLSSNIEYLLSNCIFISQ